MRKVLITLASILAVVGIILLNALTFSTRYARMMETSITVTSADNSFIGKKMKEFFARENLEEKLARELDTLPLFPAHPEYEEELASLIVSLGRDASLEQVRCQGRRYYGGYRVRLLLPREEFQLWKVFRKTGSHPSPTGTAPTSASANSPAGKKNRKMVKRPTPRVPPASSSPRAA